MQANLEHIHILYTIYNTFDILYNIQDRAERYDVKSRFFSLFCRNFKSCLSPQSNYNNRNILISEEGTEAFRAGEHMPIMNQIREGKCP